MEKKRKIITIAAIGIAALLLVVSIIITNAGLKQTKKTVTVEAGQELKLDAMDFFKITKEEAAKVQFDVSKVDINKVGEYKAIATYQKKTYTIQVLVKDTTAPEVEFLSRCAFSNDIDTWDVTTIIKSVYDVSNYSIGRIAFEKTSELSVMDEEAINKLEDTILPTTTQEELANKQRNGVPTEEGVYWTLLEFVDEYENTRYEEIYIVLDKTGALINEIPDMTVEVAKEDLEKIPEVDTSKIIVTDNVDGVISSDKITCSLEIRDEKAHTYTVHVSYTDRAGNESKMEALLTVSEGSSSSSTTSVSAGSNGNTSSGSSSGNRYGTADRDGDGVITEEEAANFIDEYEWACINAGYGNVILLSDGRYAVLTHCETGSVNGKDGFDILTEYLASLGLYANQMQGYTIDYDNDWYWFTAYDIVPLITPDDEEFWD